MNIILKITYQSHNCNFNFSAIVGNWKINFMYFISSVWHKYTVGTYVHVTVHDFSWTNYNPWIYLNTQSKCPLVSCKVYIKKGNTIRMVTFWLHDTRLIKECCKSFKSLFSKWKSYLFVTRVGKKTQSWSHSHSQRLEPQISQFDFLLISLEELLVCKVITRFN